MYSNVVADLTYHIQIAVESALFSLSCVKAPCATGISNTELEREGHLEQLHIIPYTCFSVDT